MSKPYVAIVVRVEHLVIGYIVEPGREPDPAAEDERDSKYKIGEFDKLADAQMALALAMVPTGGHA